MNEYITYGIPDKDFIRSDIPMTKEEIRVISISKLKLKEKSIVLDIGAGTGSITIEIARILKNSIVYSIEKDEKAISLIKENINKFKIKNIKIINGEAPEILNEIKKFDRVIIGGSGGRLNEILNWIDSNLINSGRIVINSVTLDTLVIAEKFLADKKYNDIEIIQVSVSKFKEAGASKMLKANYPVFIISGERP